MSFWQQYYFLVFSKTYSTWVECYKMWRLLHFSLIGLNVLQLSYICDMTLNMTELEYINYSIHDCMLVYNGVKDFLMGNNNDFSAKQNGQREAFSSHPLRWLQRGWYFKCIIIVSDGFPPLKTLSFSFNCRALSFVNLDEHESSVYTTHVYVLGKNYITDTEA